MNIETIDKEQVIKDFDRIINLTETINDKVSSLQRRKSNCSFILITCVIVLTVSILILLLDSQKKNLHVELIFSYAALPLILNFTSLFGIFYFSRLYVSIANQIEKEKSILQELHDTVDGAFRVSEKMLNPFELIYYKMRMSRLKY